MTSLEALEKIEGHYEDLGYDYDEYGRKRHCGYVYMHQMCPDECNLIRRDLTVFEIMKKNLGAPFDCLKYYETPQEWNDEYGDDYPLSIEEFDLLKEVLENGK